MYEAWLSCYPAVEAGQCTADEGARMRTALASDELDDLPLDEFTDSCTTCTLMSALDPTEGSPKGDDVSYAEMRATIDACSPAVPVKASGGAVVAPLATLVAVGAMQ